MDDRGINTSRASDALGRRGGIERAPPASGTISGFIKLPESKFVQMKFATDLVLVPPGWTSLLQSPDLCWNKPFKQRYSELYDEWCISGSETYTAAGNRRPPTKGECVSWVQAAWASVSKETVIRSFKCAGITVAVDGREDMLMSCLADNADLAEDVHQRLYQREPLQLAVREEPAEGEEREEPEHLILSEDSEYSDFDGFEPDDVLSY